MGPTLRLPSDCSLFQPSCVDFSQFSRSFDEHTNLVTSVTLLSLSLS